MTQLVTVQFHNQPLIAIEHEGKHFVAMKPIVENIGLDWKAQLQRIKRHPVLSKGVVVITTPSNGGDQDKNCLPIDMLNGWLFGVDVNRVKPAIKEKLMQYQRECFQVLYAHFNKRQPEQQPLPSIESKTVFCTPEQRTALRRLIYQGSNLHFSGRLAHSHRAQCTLLIDVKFGSKELRVKAGDFEAAKQFIADYFAEEVKLAQPSKPQTTNAVSIPPGVLEVASDMAGQVFSAVVKQAAEPYSRFARFFTDIDFDKLQVNTSKISNECYALTMDEWPSAIKEEASIKQTMSIMNACIEKLNRHHGKAIAA